MNIENQIIEAIKTFMRANALLFLSLKDTLAH